MINQFEEYCINRKTTHKIKEKPSHFPVVVFIATLHNDVKYNLNPLHIVSFRKMRKNHY